MDIFCYKPPQYKVCRPSMIVFKKKMVMKNVPKNLKVKGKKFKNLPKGIDKDKVITVKYKKPTDLGHLHKKSK